MSSSLAATVRSVLPLSLAITAAMGLIAWAIVAVNDARYMFVFVLLRWSAVFLLLPLPLIARRFDLTLPPTLRTPVTPLLLGIESVLVDIVAAQTH